MKALFITSIFVLFVLTGFAQEKDTIVATDVIIQVDGEVVYGIIEEVNKEEIKYRDNRLPNKPLITLPRSLVYMISYSNSTTQVITPTFGKRKIRKTAFDDNKLENNNYDDDGEEDNNLKYNLAHGSVKAGLGLTQDFSRIKGIEEFDKEESFPLIHVDYQIKISRLFIAGVSLGYGSNRYTYASFSEYDQIDIYQEVNETLYSLGAFARYNIMSGFVRPYALLGLNFNYTVADNTGTIFFIDESKKVSTNTSIKGFKALLLARAGVDFHIGKNFGLYTDIGLGNSLVQLGVKFILK